MTNAPSPTPQLASAGTHEHSWLGNLLQVLLGVTGGLSLLALMTHLSQRSLALELQADPFGVPFDRIEASDARVERVDAITLVAVLITGVVFAAWMFVGYRRLDPMRTDKRYGNGWAIAGWIVPFANLFVPYRVVRDLWDASVGAVADRERVRTGVRRTPFPLVPLWWGCWVLATVLGLSISRTDGQTLDDVVTVNTVAAVRFGVLVVAGALAIAVVRAVDGARPVTEKTDSHTDSGDGPGSPNQEQ